MKKRLFRTAAAGSALAGLMLMPMTAIAAPGNNSNDSTGDDIVTINLYNLTDIHGHIEQVNKKGKVTEAGLASVGCFLDKARKDNPDSSFTLLGDNIGASPFTSGILYDNPTIESLNLLKPVGSTIGNHELDLGQDAFRARLNGSKSKVNGKDVQFSKVEFPYLGANVEGLGNFADGSPYLKPYVIWEAPNSKVKVAFIGAIAEDVPYKLSPGTTKGMEFKDPISRINNLAKELKDKGEANIVVAMLDDDVKNNYPKMGKYVDGLMGGDTHVMYEFSKVNGAEGNILSADASGSYTDNMANIEVKYNKTTGKVVDSQVVITPAADVAKCDNATSPTAQAIGKVVEKAKTDSKAAGEEVIAEGIPSEVAFKRAVFADSDGKVDPGSNRGAESTLGDLVADSIKATVLTQGADPKPVDIGIINAGGMREDLEPKDGKLTYAQTYAVMPFSNELGYVTLKGAQFKKALEQQWKTDLNSQNSRPMLKLGISNNVRYTYDATKPYGQRITSITIDGKPMDMDKEYTVGSVTFLLAGGDSFDALKENGHYKTSGNLDRDKFNEYLKANATKLKANQLRRSVGINLPDFIKEGPTYSVPLRGLAFTEGPGAEVKKVTMKIGGFSVVGDVDSSLKDPDANNEKAVITTDGAGQALMKFEGDAVCKANNGKSGEYPITVTTDKGVALTADQGIKIKVECSKAAAPTTPGTDDSNSMKDSGKLDRPGKDSPNTGAFGGFAAGLAALMLALGTGLVLWRKRA